MCRLLLVLIILVSVFSNKTFAGPFTDSLSKCIVLSTSDSEHSKLVNWIFRVVSEHPDIKGSVYSENQKTMADVNTAEIFTDLLTERCKKEAYEAIKFEGEEALENSFNMLGEVAMQKMMEDRKVLESIQNFIKYIDYEKFEYIFGDLYNK